jgi:FAD/FMN-containing dehydrogenase
MPVSSKTRIASWGRVAAGEHILYGMHFRADGFPQEAAAQLVLPFGNGRSYGDSCLNSGGALLQTRRLDRFIRFDPLTGVLACEAGVLLGDILRIVMPQGWFLPVVPGTQFVTVGGAIANDVHGKNHHTAGTFGTHVRSLELLRSDGQRLTCSPWENVDWFSATVGGLGLTGVVVAAELQLRPIAGPSMEVETIRYRNLREFFDLCEESDATHEYTVAWVDCLAKGDQLGRGLFQRANHAAGNHLDSTPEPWRPSIPFTPPISMVNRTSLRLFNMMHYRTARRSALRQCNFSKFFFPLDNLRNWNRLYGPRGFFQYQCVLPQHCAREATHSLLEQISSSRLGSFLAVLKVFGATVSPGMLSFPSRGATLALDFPNQHRKTEPLFERLDRLVADAGGRLYPAKDARMPAVLFRSGYPRWRAFSRFIDPQCSSDFWRRVTSA